MVTGSRSGTGLKSETTALRSMPSAMCSALEQLVCSAFVQEFKVTIKGQKTQLQPLLQPCYRFYTQLKVNRVQLICAAHGTQETTIEGQQKSVATATSAMLPF